MADFSAFEEFERFGRCTPICLLHPRSLSERDLFPLCRALLAQGYRMKRMSLRIEDIGVTRRDEDVVAAGETEIGRLVALQLEMDPVFIADQQLQPHETPKRRDPLDAGVPARVAVPHASHLEIVRPDVDLGLALGTELGDEEGMLGV